MHALIKIFKTTSFRDGGSGSLFLKSCLEELELFVHTPPLGDHRLQVQAHDSRLGNGKLPSCHGFAGTRDNRARKSNPCLAGRGEHRSVIRGRTLCFLASHWPLLACLRLRLCDVGTEAALASGSHSLLSVLGGAPGRGADADPCLQ
jgi:hypothetical protein